MRLAEIEEWHPGMLDSLAAAHRDRWTTTDHLLRRVVYGLDLLWRQMVKDGGGDEPEAVEILAPGEKPRTKSWVGQLRSIAKKGGA